MNLISFGYKPFSEVTTDSVPVVREFPDMFPKDLLGLPPDRELEFRIELLPGSASIFIPSYRMALAEF